MIARPFVRQVMLPVRLLNRMDRDCKTTTNVSEGGELIVVARDDRWFFVKQASDNTEGWIDTEFMRYGFKQDRREASDCIDLQWSVSGVRVKNTCDRDISDMWICVAKRDRKSCGTNWHRIGRLDAGKTDVLRSMSRQTSSWWFWRICFEPGRIQEDGSNYYCG